MRINRIWSIALAGVLVVSVAACEDDAGGPSVDAGVSRDGAAGSDTGGSAVSDAPAQTLFQRLGGEPGIRAVITDFVGNRVLKDPRINGYFLNSTVDGTRLINCLVLQVGTLAGGPAPQFIYPSAGCRNMKESHAGMKISMQDFNDLAGHLVAALGAAGVAQSDIDAVVAAVAPTANDIVEDKNNNATVYQRVGRKPAISAVIDLFIAKVVADARINGFFGAANAGRLKTCLVRQVCSIDGPCKYGQEVDGEPGVGTTDVCKSMKASHMGLTSPAGGAAGSRGITKADFDALVEDLVLVLDAAGVPAADKMAILSALAPTCGDIVAGGTGCPAPTAAP